VTSKQYINNRTLLIAAPFKGDALSLQKVLQQQYATRALPNLVSLSSAIGEQTGLIILTEEALVGDVACFGNALDQQPAWSEIPIILLASSQGRSGRDTDLARRRLPSSAGHVIALERPLSSASLLSAVAAAWRARERQFDMRDRLAELAEERGRLHILLENVPVGISFMDKQGQSLISNPLYRQYLPRGVIPSKDSTEMPSWEGLDPQGNRLAPDMYPGARALRGESATGVEFRHRSGDDGESWRRVSAVPLFDQSREIIGAAAVIVDINEEKHAELSLRRFNEELEIQVQARTQELKAVIGQLKKESDERLRAEERLRHSFKMEAVGQLTGGIAHDFNNMLTGVIGSLDLIKMRLAKGNTDGIDRFMEAANTSAQRAASLTQRLLAFSRRQSLNAQAVSVNQLVLALQDLLYGSVPEHLNLIFDLSDEDPWICADANQLENAILNLVINARDATPEGGTLTVSTRLDPSESSDEPGTVVIEIRDTGCGIPPGVLDKVMEPFFTTKPIGQGTGLGLSMVYGFAKQSNGRLDIESTPEVGTTVSIVLPEHPRAIPDSPPASGATVPGKGQSILLVEDDDSVRLINQEVLRELGYEVTTARDAEEALKHFHALDQVDLLVTDVGLPGMNGRQLAEVIQHAAPQLPVLFLTGYAAGARDRADFLGPHMQLLTKPFSLDALASRVADMLAHSEQMKPSGAETL
jgi:signal transduction histidine kinase/CheY-like chemotaxis protein